MKAKHSKIIIACSGGPDSMALLHKQWKALSSQKIICAHFNHRWNVKSKNALELVEDFCKKHKIQFVSGEAPSEGRTSEEEARKLRYGFLFGLAKKLFCQSLLTAHHKDDQSETFVFRLLRGTGPEGAEGIKSLNVIEGIKIERPLLKNTKEELLAYCKKYKIPFYVDSSNQDTQIKRNLIREEIFPLCKKINPQFKKKIIEFQDLVCVQNDFIENFVDGLSPKYFYNITAFLSQHKALRRAILKRLLTRNSLSVNFELIERLLEAIVKQETTKITLSESYFFEVKNKKFSIVKTEKKQKKVFPHITFTFDERRVNVEGFGFCTFKPVKRSLKHIPKEKNSNRVYLDLADYKGQELVFRARKPSDIFWPLGLNAPIKLKDFLINRKVSAKLKKPTSEIPLLALKNSAEILWIPGVEISERVKVCNFSSHLLEWSE